MAVTVTYEWPVAGITAPTTTQMSKRNIVTATVIKTADGDTTATVTHNLQLTAAQLAAGFPKITLTPLLLLFYTTLPFVASVTATTAVITMATTGGTGNASAQFRVTVERPTSKTK